MTPMTLQFTNASDHEAIERLARDPNPARAIEGRLMQAMDMEKIQRFLQDELEAGTGMDILLPLMIQANASILANMFLSIVSPALDSGALSVETVQRDGRDFAHFGGRQFENDMGRAISILLENRAEIEARDEALKRGRTQ